MELPRLRKKIKVCGKEKKGPLQNILVILYQF